MNNDITIEYQMNTKINYVIYDKILAVYVKKVSVNSIYSATCSEVFSGFRIKNLEFRNSLILIQAIFSDKMGLKLLTAK